MRSIISDRLSLRVRLNKRNGREKRERERVYRGESEGRTETRKGLTTALNTKEFKKKKAIENGLGLD